MAPIGTDADPRVAPAATPYLGATELTDPNTASGSTGDVTGVRTYSFAGSPVAMRVGSQVNMGASPKVTGISYVFSDAQGSVRGAMSDARTTTFAPSVSGATYQHMAYLPFGQTRGTDELTAYDKGWLGQVADGSTTASSSTGLVYLNARYYDPAASRFVSPDPVVKPSDPRTLDAYVYGANNPASFTDASGKWACPSYLTGAALDNCNAYANNTANYMTGAKGTSQAGTVHVVKAKAAAKIDLPASWINGCDGRRCVGDAVVDQTAGWISEVPSTSELKIAHDYITLDDFWTSFYCGDASQCQIQGVMAFGTYFQRGGPGDLKVRIRETHTVVPFAVNGYFGVNALGSQYAVRYDTFGNIFFGVAAKYAGIPAGVASAAQGDAPVLRDHPGADYPFDGIYDPVDSAAVRIGYNLYDRYGTNVPPNALIEAIVTNQDLIDGGAVWSLGGSG